jgi:hypothetical protein
MEARLISSTECLLVRGVGHESDGSRTLDSGGELALMLCTGAGHTAGQDLTALAGETAKTGNVLIIDMLDLIYAERADLPARLAATGTAYAIASIFRHVPYPP